MRYRIVPGIGFTLRDKVWELQETSSGRLVEWLGGAFWRTLAIHENRAVIEDLLQHMEQK